MNYSKKYNILNGKDSPVYLYQLKENNLDESNLLVLLKLLK